MNRLDNLQQRDQEQPKSSSVQDVTSLADKAADLHHEDQGASRGVVWILSHGTFQQQEAQTPAMHQETMGQASPQVVPVVSRLVRVFQAPYSTRGRGAAYQMSAAKEYGLLLIRSGDM